MLLQSWSEPAGVKTAAMLVTQCHQRGNDGSLIFKSKDLKEVRHQPGSNQHEFDAQRIVKQAVRALPGFLLINESQQSGIVSAVVAHLKTKALQATQITCEPRMGRRKLFHGDHAAMDRRRPAKRSQRQLWR